MKRSALVLIACVALPESAQSADSGSEFAERSAAIVARASATTKAQLAKEHYLLGVWAKEQGISESSRAQFQAALAADPAHEGAHLALNHVRAGREWISFEEAMARKGLVQRGGNWILKEEAALLDLPAQEKAKRAAEQDRFGKLLKTYAAAPERTKRFALEALGTVEDEYKFEPLAWALRSRHLDLRLVAAKELGRLGDRRGLRPLLRRAVRDSDETVRQTSIAAAKQIGDPNLVVALIPALSSDDAQVRANAAYAIGEVGDVRGVRYLVYRYEAHGGSSQRVYAGFINQVSFIQDFDVEVAQTAFIADPQVGAIQEGLVVDVQVVATSAVGEIYQREVIHSALRKLTGATDVPNKRGAWAAWWKEHGEQLEAAAATR
jgi:hypothetical protein